MVGSSLNVRSGIKTTYVFPTSDVCGDFVLFEMALSISPTIRVFLLRFQTTSVDHVFVGGGGVTSIATTIDAITVNAGESIK
jgi:hypothetical protein